MALFTFKKPDSYRKSYILAGSLLLLVILLVAALIYQIQLNTRLMAQLQKEHASTGSTQSARTVATVSSTSTTHTIQRILGKAAPTPLISQGVPAFSTVSYNQAVMANDGSYNTAWRSQGTPAWLAYDLSSVATAQRNTILVAWYNETFNYDHTIVKDNAYNIPQDYTIDVNPGVGGGYPPTTGWTTVVTVKGNHYHSRQHVITFQGNNWLRMTITAADGSLQNFDASLNLDIFAAPQALNDDWMFYGDSITAGAMAHTTLSGVNAFSQLIQAKKPKSFPVQEDGGIGYLGSADAVKYINTWLPLFPGKYVGLSYGSNDANSCLDPVSFYNNYTSLVEAVLQAGKIPVIPHIPWGRVAAIQKCGPALNAQIDALYKAFPQIIHGPDFWTFFLHNQSLISQDNIHPTDAGFAAYRQQWATTMLTAGLA